VLAVHVVVLVLGFTAVRTAFRAYSYLEIATYYFSMTSFAFLVLAAEGLARVRERAPSLDRIVVLAAGGAAAVSTVVSYFGIQRALAPYPAFAEMALSSVRAIRDALAATGSCYGGSLDALGRRVLSPQSGPLVLFGADACTVRRDAVGAYLAWRDGGYALVTLPTAATTVWPLEATPDWIEDAAGWRAAVPPGETVSTFARPWFDPGEVAVRVTNAREGGLWVGYRSR
jgi:hypothetical protein